MPLTGISRHIWETKYRYRDETKIYDQSIDDSWHRIADAIAAAESDRVAEWARLFFDVLKDFRFLPGGRIQAGAGTGHRVTLFNCFVMGAMEDSMDGIFDALKEGALTLQAGGGIGYDFSSLRPKGMPARNVGSVASGPVSFMHIWDSMCATLLSTGARRGAMMATLRCDHPDIEEFIAVKKDPARLRHFNLSVLVNDKFMEAVRGDADWSLVFPREADVADGSERAYSEGGPSGSAPSPRSVHKRIKARALWDKIMAANYEYAEPGVLFIDRINQGNNLYYRETISATNPCGEIPLPPYGACDLGSLNLACFVEDPFSSRARLDMDGLAEAARIAVRILDNVIDISLYPLERQREQACGSRRIGLGITGLADALIMMGMDYGGAPARDTAGVVMRTICHNAYWASVELAKEKGPFPFFDRDAYLKSRFVATLPEELRAAIARHGIRNSHLTAIAPTGTVSLLAGNVSSGIEPVFDLRYRRRVLELDGGYTEYELSDYAYRLWRERFGEQTLPASFVAGRDLPPEAHIDMQAAVQQYVDNAISKTINVPSDFSFERFRALYQYAYEKGLKGCTLYRPNPVTGAVLAHGEAPHHPPLHCCDVEREAD